MYLNLFIYLIFSVIWIFSFICVSFSFVSSEILHPISILLQLWISPPVTIVFWSLSRNRYFYLCFLWDLIFLNFDCWAGPGLHCWKSRSTFLRTTLLFFCLTMSHQVTQKYLPLWQYCCFSNYVTEWRGKKHPFAWQDHT